MERKEFGSFDQKLFDRHAFCVGYYVTNVFYSAIEIIKGSGACLQRKFPLLYLQHCWTTSICKHHWKASIYSFWHGDDNNEIPNDQDSKLWVANGGKIVALEGSLLLCHPLASWLLQFPECLVSALRSRINTPHLTFKTFSKPPLLITPHLLNLQFFLDKSPKIWILWLSNHHNDEWMVCRTNC